MDGCAGNWNLMALTFLAVCIGYIFFRAESVRQAFAMLKAIASISSYHHLALDHSFYAMTLLAVIGYFAVIGAGDSLIVWGRLHATGPKPQPARSNICSELWSAL
jgi:hypothetical protein